MTWQLTAGHLSLGIKRLIESTQQQTETGNYSAAPW